MSSSGRAVDSCRHRASAQRANSSTRPALARKPARHERDEAIDAADALPVLEQIVEDDGVLREGGGVGLSRAAARQGHPLAALRGKWQALRRWSTFRSHLPPASAIEAVTTASEREILAIQRTIGFDIYWRFYFSLVNPH